MTQAATIPAPAMPSAWKMYRALVGIGLCCGLLIVTVFEVTRPIIQANKIEARKAAILEVVPGAESSRSFRHGESGQFEPVPDDSEESSLVFAGFDAESKLVGVALQAQGMGYQDIVVVLYGYSFDKRAIVGIKVLESKETPGLGDRVETDPGYQANFEALDVTLNAAGTELQNPIQFTKQGKKQNPWQIDGITGATITSKAIADMLAKSAASWIARVESRRTDFEAKE